MSDVMIDAFTDLRLWLVVLIWGAIMMLERWVVFRASQRKGQAFIDDLPGLSQERKEWAASFGERLGSSALLLASIPLFGQLLKAIAGTGEASRATFVLLVGISYLVRNWLIIILSGGIVSTFL